MTGHGRAQVQTDDLRVTAEIRAVNNRFLKVSVNCAERYTALETEVQALVRQYVRRGSVSITLKLERIGNEVDSFRINPSVLRAYQRQLRGLDPDQAPVPYVSLLSLPGAIEEVVSDDQQHSQQWAAIQQALQQALAELVAMRRQEGHHMASDLEANCAAIEQRVNAVAQRAPEVVEEYQKRLTDRLNHLLATHDLNVQPGDIIREVGLFADRCDISEEVVRLRSHLSQFRGNIRSDAADGRKLEFLTQELLRETNTIGSKANDAEVAGQVVEIKTAIERIREMIQNVQ